MHSLDIISASYYLQAMAFSHLISKWTKYNTALNRDSIYLFSQLNEDTKISSIHLKFTGIIASCTVFICAMCSFDQSWICVLYLA